MDGRGSKYLKLINSTVSHLRLHYGPLPKGYTSSANFFIEFENSIIENYVEIALNYAFFKGNISFRREGLLHAELSVQSVNFQKGTVIREYPLFVKDETGNPASNASIWLYSPEGELISKQTTDWKGMVTFNITFTKENYSKKWNLKVTCTV